MEEIGTLLRSTTGMIFTALRATEFEGFGNQLGQVVCVLNIYTEQSGSDEFKSVTISFECQVGATAQGGMTKKYGAAIGVHESLHGGELSRESLNLTDCPAPMRFVRVPWSVGYVVITRSPS
jgi:hypothetical protein